MPHDFLYKKYKLLIPLHHIDCRYGDQMHLCSTEGCGIDKYKMTCCYTCFYHGSPWDASVSTDTDEYTTHFSTYDTESAMGAYTTQYWLNTADIHMKNADTDFHTSPINTNSLTTPPTSSHELSSRLINVKIYFNVTIEKLYIYKYNKF